MNPEKMYYNIFDFKDGRFLFGVNFVLFSARDGLQPVITLNRYPEGFKPSRTLMQNMSPFLEEVLNFAEHKFSGVESLEIRASSMVLQAPVWQVDKLKAMLIELAENSGHTVSHGSYELTLA